MSNTPPVIPTTPPTAAPVEAPPPALPVEDPQNTVPITGLFGAVEAILRHPLPLAFQLTQSRRDRLIGSLLVIGLVCSLVFGFVAGTFSGGQQLWIAPVKIATGLLISSLICLPSLYIFACLSGCAARPAEIAGLLAGSVSLSTILLVGFAPVAWVFSQSTESLAGIGFLYLLFWFVAAGFGFRFLWTGFSRFKSRSHGGLFVWICIFFLVTLQMTTALRPILGKSSDFLPSEKQFFLEHWGQNLSLTSPDQPGQ